MLYYIGVAARPGIRSAAIAQPVERILGKDEVTSSNLVSSSNIKHSNLTVWVLFVLSS